MMGGGGGGGGRRANSAFYSVKLYNYRSITKFSFTVNNSYNILFEDKIRTSNNHTKHCNEYSDFSSASIPMETQQFYSESCTVADMPENCFGANITFLKTKLIPH